MKPCGHHLALLDGIEEHVVSRETLFTVCEQSEQTCAAVLFTAAKRKRWQCAKRFTLRKLRALCRSILPCEKMFHVKHRGFDDKCVQSLFISGENIYNGHMTCFT